MKPLSEPLSLKNCRKQRYSYFLYDYENEAVKRLARGLGISASEMISMLVSKRLEMLEIKIENNKNL